MAGAIVARPAGAPAAPAGDSARATTTCAIAPAPGRLLQETDLETAVVTGFRVDHLDVERSSVTISTTLQSRGGLFAPLERFMTQIFLQRVYREELAPLAAQFAMPAKRDAALQSG